MAFTTTTRIQNLISQSGSGLHHTFDSGAVTNAAAFSNERLEKLGVPSTETDEGLLGIADRLALSYLLEGLILQQAMRGNSQATGSLRILAGEMRDKAIEEAGAYVTYTTRKTTVANNRNWAHERGGPLRRPSEAGTYRRTTR